MLAISKEAIEKLKKSKKKVEIVIANGERVRGFIVDYDENEIVLQQTKGGLRDESELIICRGYCLIMKATDGYRNS